MVIFPAMKRKKRISGGAKSSSFMEVNLVMKILALKILKNLILNLFQMNPLKAEKHGEWREKVKSAQVIPSKYDCSSRIFISNHY